MPRPKPSSQSSNQASTQTSNRATKKTSRKSSPASDANAAGPAGPDSPDSHAPHIAVIYSRYNASITESLAMAAIETCMVRTGFTPAVFACPGAYELTALAMAAARTERYHGIVALGCIIKGETSHDQHIAAAVAHGLTNVTLLTDIPVAFGVLTTNTADQARARAGLPPLSSRTSKRVTSRPGSRAPKHQTSNKGHEAMDALLDTLESLAIIANPDAWRPESTANIISTDNHNSSERQLPDKAASRPAPSSKKGGTK